MNPDQMKLAMLMPLASILVVVVIGGGLGAIFIGVGKAGGGEWGAIIIGLALVVMVPTVAFLLERLVDRDGASS